MIGYGRLDLLCLFRYLVMVLSYKIKNNVMRVRLCVSYAETSTKESSNYNYRILNKLFAI